jgi:phosphoribosylformylglycinamidine synthase PurS subunit
LDFDEVQDATQGKVIELKLADGERGAVEARVKEMCEKLLANTVIESYRIELDEAEE